jgi:hypothetical protein
MAPLNAWATKRNLSARIGSPCNVITEPTRFKAGRVIGPVTVIGDPPTPALEELVLVEPLSQNPANSELLQFGIVTCKPVWLRSKSKGNNSPVLKSLNNNASVAIKDNGAIPLLLNPCSTMKPNGFINTSSGVTPPQLRAPNEPASLLGPVSMRPKINCTPVVPLPSNCTELAGGISKRPKE